MLSIELLCPTVVGYTTRSVMVVGIEVGGGGGGGVSVRLCVVGAESC